YPGANPFCRSHWRGGLEDNQISLPQDRGDHLRRLPDISQIRFVSFLERSRDRQDERIRRFWIQRDTELPRRHRALHQHVEIRLNDVDLPAIDHFNDGRVDLDANHFKATAGEYRSNGQADIAQTEYGN